MSRLPVIVFVLAATAWMPRAACGNQPVTADRPLILKIALEDEPITPTTARFIRRAIQQAENEGAACLVIVLDTPGGLVDSTRSVVKDILASATPVVVYVSPAGARAASAGVFITLASHVAAMAPGTHIGAAHPVELGGLPIAPPGLPPSEPDHEQPGRAAPTSSPVEAKIVNDTVAWARALAQLRGRNEGWAAQAVTESVTVTASEAVAAGVVDLTAADLDSLLAQLEEREIRLPQGPVTLHTTGATVRTLEMWWGERLLGLISNPTVAFLLLVLGFYGVLFELYTPGWGVAGTLGVICLVVAFFGLAVLPVNYVGLALVLLGLGLFAAEAFVTSHGLVALGGAICLALGGLMLVDSPLGFMRVSMGVVVPVAAASGAISVFLVGSVIRAHRGRTRTGAEGLVAEQAVAQDDFTLRADRYVGVVLAHGELWKAESAVPVATGQVVEVQGVRGLTLDVGSVTSAPSMSGTEPSPP
jgi:membrane-bound serine protease (ClpP class)